MIFLVASGMADATEQPDAQNAAASTPAVPYRSVFDGYQSVADVPVKPWRATNEEIGKSPGHSAHSAPGMSDAPSTNANGESNTRDAADHDAH